MTTEKKQKSGLAGLVATTVYCVGAGNKGSQQTDAGVTVETQRILEPSGR